MLAKDEATASFIAAYKRRFNVEPVSVSMLSYRVVGVISRIAAATKDVSAKSFLATFVAERARDANLGRNPHLYVHETTQKGESLVTTIPAVRERP